VLGRAVVQAPLPLRLRLGQFIRREHLGRLRHLQLRVGIAPLGVRQVVHREQPVAAENLPIHFHGQDLGVFETLGNRRREVDMYAAFVAGDAQGNAYVILALRLDVGAGGGADIQFAGLGGIARVVLVADGHRRQVE